MEWKRHTVYVGCIVILSGFVQTNANPPGAAGQATNVRWEQTQAVNVRIGIKGYELAQPSVDVACSVRNLGPKGVKSTVTRQLSRDKELSIYFPEDFGRKPLPGEYTWLCEVAGRAVAQGRFAFASPSEARLIEN